jgi:hypothetical protein
MNLTNIIRNFFDLDLVYKKKPNLSDSNLDFASSYMPTLSKSPIGASGAYGYYVTKEYQSKSKLNHQALAALTGSIALAGGFVFVGTVGYGWLMAWIILALIDLVLVIMLGKSHLTYLHSLEPAKLKYIALSDVSNNDLKNIVRIAWERMPAMAFTDSRVLAELKSELNLGEDVLEIISVLAYEFEGNAKELILTAKNLLG